MGYNGEPYAHGARGVSKQNNHMYYAKYSEFRVSGSGESYKLRIGGYSGTAGDCMTRFGDDGDNNNAKFSTSDVDNDMSSSNCAARYGGGWWWSNCGFSRLHGVWGEHIVWSSLNEHSNMPYDYPPLTSTIIKIRRKI